jgi:lipopolysaccharide/colanic/teichoic acid biosynthesis glycosyltransferase
MMKRLFDILFSLVAFMVFALPTLVIAILLLFKEKHALFFKQERVGKNKKKFEILKFQTLVDGIPTPTGKILRRTGLDEIPQFINVLKGDMSIVGPRALTMFDVQRLNWDDTHHEKRWSIRPGITGFAQIYGGQHRKTSWFWDTQYLKKNHVFIDFAILAISFLMNLFGKTRVRKVIFQKNHLK